MPYGHNGKILRVNLSKGEISIEEPDEAIYRKYLGGGALAAYYLLRGLEPGVEPVSPDNIIVFMTGLIAGTNISGNSRYTVAAKSPLTNGYGESEAGGWWGPELKFAGFDGIIVKGKSEKPVYLWIHDGEVEIRDASQYWGVLSGEVQDGILEELGDPRIRVLQTGVAGEKLVRYAAVVNELRHYNGRTGMGAVMGSKNLKAIAVRGTKRLEIADKEAAKEIRRWYAEVYDRDNDFMHLYGTSRVVGSLSASGILPTRNFHEGEFEHAEEITGQKMAETILKRRGTCYACLVACKREVEDEETGLDPKYGGPEYETIAANGSLCGIGDLKKIAMANQLLNQYVLDSISTGAIVAFAMECYENGILTKEDTDGLELNFGNAGAAIELIKKIGKREGIGDLLAEGVKRAAEKIGKGAEKYALHVKGQELPMHEPRGKTSLALAYSTSATGADHIEAPHDVSFVDFNPQKHKMGELGLIEPLDMLDFSYKKVRAYYYSQLLWSAYNSLGQCDFAAVPIGTLRLNKLIDYINAVTGWDMSLWELLKVGERANAMYRIFNYHEGFTKDDDTLPERIFQELENGVLKGEKIDKEEFEKALALFYEMSGWDETGYPKKSKLFELGLDWLVKE